MTAPPVTPRRREGAFTLLEIMAVVAIFALVAGIALPNFSTLHARAVENEARELVALIELARQRAIVTGVPHRLHIDIDGAAYRVEWLGREPEVAEDAAPADPNALTSDVYTFELVPPRQAERAYTPLVGKLGRFNELADSIHFAAVETDGGWTDQGEATVDFEQDGSADPTTIVIEHSAGYAASLEILPLASRVRVVHETP